MNLNEVKEGLLNSANNVLNIANKTTELEKAKKHLKDLKLELADRYLMAIESDDKLIEIINEINVTNEQIVSLEKEIDTLKNIKRCSNCGCVNPTESKFCNQCGTEFESEPLNTEKESEE